MRKKLDLTGQRFGRLLVIEEFEPNIIHKHSIRYWKCKCDCGNEKIIRQDALRQGSTKSCGCLLKDTAKQLIEKQHQKNNQKYSLIGQRFGKLVVIEDTGKRTSQKRIIYRCKCDCGNYHETSSAILKSGDCISCGCLKQSKGEYLIENFLKEHHINYKKEYSCKELKTNNNGYYRFDFAILQENKIKYLIEFDGKQHFYATDTKRFNEEYLKEIQQHDEEKNQFCQNNNITLIRIKYSDINNIEKILLNKLF